MRRSRSPWDGGAERSCPSLGPHGTWGTAQSPRHPSDGAGEEPARRLRPSAGTFSFWRRSWRLKCRPVQRNPPQGQVSPSACVVEARNLYGMPQTALVRGAEGFVFPPVWFLIQGRKHLRRGSEAGEDGLSGPSQIILRIQSCCCACSRRDLGTWGPEAGGGVV